MTLLLLASATCLAAGIVVDLIAGTGRRGMRPVPYLLGAVGAGLLTGLGGWMLAGNERSYSLGRLFTLGTTSLRADPLAGLFLTLTAGLGVLVSLCFASWVLPEGRVRGRGLAAGYLVLLTSTAVIVLAGDAFLFLFAWEGLTLAFFVVASHERASEEKSRAAWLTAVFGKLSGASLLVSFLLLAGSSGSLVIGSWTGVPGGALRSAAYALAVVGFGAKVGVAPLQVWIPVGYPAAPGPARAAMAGVAVNVGFYGMWRVLATLGPPPIWLPAVVLVLGGITALLGIAFAAVETDLDRLIAYSSVENSGIILTAYGVALTGAWLGEPRMVAVGLLAATLHVVSHALAKSSLFLAAVNLEARRGTARIDQLAGAGRDDPISGAAMGVAAITLAGLPPTVGFVSEWFVLESLLQQFRVHELALRLSMAWAGALVALTAGVAALTFLRVIGFVVLGRPARRHRGPGWFGTTGLVLCAAACLAVAAVTPWEIRVLSSGLSPVVPASVTRGALGSPWVLQPVFGEFSILSPSWLWILMPLLLAGTIMFAIVASRGGLLRVRRVPAWRSAGGGVAGIDRYTAFGYANPIRHVLANLLRTRRDIQTGGDDRDLHLIYTASVVEPAEAYLYWPVQRATMWVVEHVKRLQSGRLDAYVAYMLVALLAVLAVASALR